MRIAALALLPFLAVPAAADLAQDAFQWAADIIDGNSAPAPKSDDVHIMDGWKWSDCGTLCPLKRFIADRIRSPLRRDVSVARHGRRRRLERCLGGKPLTISTIDSIKLKPDPPKPGQNLTVTVEGTANERIEVSAMARASTSTAGMVTPHFAAHKH